MYHLEEERVQAAQILVQESLGKEAHSWTFRRFEVGFLLKHQPCSPCFEGSWAVQMRSTRVREKVQAWSEVVSQMIWSEPSHSKPEFEEEESLRCRLEYRQG